MAYLLYVRGAAGNVAVPDLGITVAQGPSWTLLSATSPQDADGQSGQFSARELRDSADLYALVTAGTLEWSKDGASAESAGDYVADFMIMQDFADDWLDLTSGILTVPNATEAPSPGHLGNIFWDTDNKGLYMHDGTTWTLVATASGVNTEHGLLTGLDDDDHDQYLLLSGNDVRNAVTGAVDFSGATGLVLPAAVDRTGLLTTEGSIMWDTDDDMLWFYDGTQWVNLVNTLSGVLSHNDLTDIGTYLHTEIDSHIDDSTIHFTESSIDHNNILNNGTYSHSSIDSHIDDSTIHFTQSSIDHGVLLGLGDDDHPQYAHEGLDETISGVWTFATEATEPAFVITPDTDAPTTKLADGAIAIIDGLFSVYDGTRTKWLSVDRAVFEAGRRGAATNIYLRTTGDEVPSNVSSYVMPRNGTIVAMTAGTESAATWTFEIHVNGSPVATLSCSGTSTVATDKDVDFSAGDSLQFYCNGTAVPWPVGLVEVAWRE